MVAYINIVRQRFQPDPFLFIAPPSLSPLIPHPFLVPSPSFSLSAQISAAAVRTLPRAHTVTAPASEQVAADPGGKVALRVGAEQHSSGY